MIISRAREALAVIVGVMALTPPAHASPIIYFAEDNCNGDCTNSPNSDVAHDDFLSKINNAEVEGFEKFGPNFYTELTITSFAQAGKVTLKGDFFQIKEGGGGYGTKPVGGQKFLETIAGIEFYLDFEHPVAAFGFYATDVGDVQGSLQIKTSLGGSAGEEHVIALSSTTTSGDHIFWGIIDENTFDKVEFHLIHSNEVDFFGFDEFTVAQLGQINIDPSPIRFDDSPIGVDNDYLPPPSPLGVDDFLPPPSPFGLDDFLPPPSPFGLDDFFPPPVEPYSIGGASGDPHFRTWAGETFDFHGVCDLVLLSNPGFRDNVGLDINIRTKRSRQWSYIESAAVRIGDDSVEVKGSQDEDNFWVNKVSVHPSTNGKEMTVAGYPIVYKEPSSKSRQFDIDLGKGVKIQIKTWNKYVSVQVIGANEADFNGALGLMGTFPESIKLARDNKTVIDDVKEFGKEWQVLASEDVLFHNVEGPQAPEACQIPSSLDMRRRLGESMFSQKDAELACSRVSTEDFDLCVFDVMATNEKDIAGAY